MSWKGSVGINFNYILTENSPFYFFLLKVSLHASDWHGKLKGNLKVLENYFCMVQTRSEDYKQFKSFPISMLSIRGPSECPDEYGSGQGSGSFQRAASTFWVFPRALMFGAYERISPGVFQGFCGEVKQIGRSKNTDLSSFCVFGGSELTSALSHKHIGNIKRGNYAEKHKLCRCWKAYAKHDMCT